MDPMGEVRAPKMNGVQWLVVIVVDILILAELALAMYEANGNPDNFTPVFIKTFFGMLIPTLLIGYLCKRMLRPTSERIKS